MSTKAYVLVDTTVGRAKDVAQAIRKIEGVTEAYSIIGPHDVLAIVQGADLNQVNNVVSRGIHHLPGVTRTLTCVAINA